MNPDLEFLEVNPKNIQKNILIRLHDLGTKIEI